MIARRPVLTLAALVAGACSSSPPPPPPPPPRPVVLDAGPPDVGPPPDAAPAQPARTYLLERFGNIGVVQAYLDHFEELPLSQQILAYHLYRAGVAGDRMAYDQRGAHHLAIKDLLEALVVTGAASPPMEEYLKMFWVNHGVYEHRTSRKFVPTGFTWEQLRDAARTARGAIDRTPACQGWCATALGGADQAATDRLVESLRRPVFDAAYQPACTNKSPPRGQDIITASSNTFYPGLTARDLEGFRDRYPLNSRVVRQGRRLVEQPYRAGDAQNPPGIYAEDLRGVLVHLNDAIAAGSERQRSYWGHLARFFTTGDPEAFRQYNIGWVQDDPQVDSILGFIESYVDARGQRGMWESIVYYRNEGQTAMMRRLAENSQYFEERTPWDIQYRRTEFHPLVATTIDVMHASGDGGPLTPLGINLPNEEAIREHHGSRNFYLGNTIAAMDGAESGDVLREFLATPAEVAEAQRCEEAVAATMTALHEVTGHASGRVSPTLRGDPHQHLQQYYSTLEEARAELVSLWHVSDQRVVELGLVPQGCTRAAYMHLVNFFLKGLRRYPTQATFEEDHDRARAMIINWAREHHALNAEQINGHWFLRIPDNAAFRTAVGQLLAELQRIKATGDFNAIRRLVEQYGVNIEAAWRDDVVARAQRVGLAVNWAVIEPRLVAVRDAEGRITDVRVERPESFRAYQLEWSALARDSRTTGARLAPPATPTPAPAPAARH